MKRLISVIALLFLTGCAAVSSIPTHATSEGGAIRASGGSFGVSDSGNYDLTKCRPPGGLGVFTFNGSGSANFIHKEIETGRMNSDDSSCNGWRGSATLTSAARPRNSIKMKLSTTTNNTPCVLFGHAIKFTVTGGTGRFANATGTGTVAFACHSNGTYTDKWSGTVTF